MVVVAATVGGDVTALLIAKGCFVHSAGHVAADIPLLKKKAVRNEYELRSCCKKSLISSFFSTSGLMIML